MHFLCVVPCVVRFWSCTFSRVASCCTFFVLHSFRAVLVSYWTLFKFHIFYVVHFSYCTFPCCTFFILHYFRVALISWCAHFMLNFSVFDFVHVALFLCRTFFRVELFWCWTFCALFSCCTFLVLYTFRVVLFSCWVLFMLHFFLVAPFSCCTFLCVALLLCCTFSRFASWCTLSMLHFLGIQASNFIKKRLHHGCFPVKFLNFLRTPILENICEWPVQKNFLKLSQCQSLTI